MAQAEQRNPTPTPSKTCRVLVASTGFKTANGQTSNYSSIITSGCNQVPLQHCQLMYISVQKVKQANDINPYRIRKAKTHGSLKFSFNLMKNLKKKKKSWKSNSSLKVKGYGNSGYP